MKKGNGMWVLLVMFFIAVIGFSGWKLYGIYAEYQKGEDAYEELAGQYVTERVPETEQMEQDMDASDDMQPEEDMEEQMISVDVAALKAKYPDVVGWIYCPGTAINYPIVQSADNDYYLHRLMNGEYSLGGTLFMDYRNAEDFSDWNSIVYGHNMKNGSMFAGLTEYYEQEYYVEHPIWYLFTEDCTYQVELVGGYTTPADSDTYSFPANAKEKDALANKADRSSSFSSEVVVGEEERLITFSTCVYDYENARYVLVGVLREMAEASDVSDASGGDE